MHEGLRLNSGISIYHKTKLLCPSLVCKLFFTWFKIPVNGLVKISWLRKGASWSRFLDKNTFYLPWTSGVVAERLRHRKKKLSKRLFFTSFIFSFPQSTCGGPQQASPSNINGFNFRKVWSFCVLPRFYMCPHSRPCMPLSETLEHSLSCSWGTRRD